MSGGEQRKFELSMRRIVGFACLQAFAYFLLYPGARASNTAENTVPFHAGALVVLAATVAGFLVVRCVGPHRVNRLLSRPLLYAYGCVAFGSAAVVAFATMAEWYWLVAAGALMGVPYALLTTAWARSFSATTAANAVPEVFLGSLVAATLCFVFALFEVTDFLVLAVGVLPLVGVVNIEMPEASGGELRAPAIIDAQSDPARKLSLSILSGTCLLGAAGGVAIYFLFGLSAQAFGFQLGMLLLAAFLLGGLTLLLSHGFGRGEALSKSYRLSVFVMMTGILLMSVPFGGGSVPYGQSAMLAGFLGFEAVLFSLFIVMAEITATDCTVMLPSGLTALFAGGFVGVLLASVALPFVPGYLQGSVALVVSGVSVLVAYVFLFTERDFSLLSEIVSAGDTFEEICASITSEYKLSKRESEILMYALRGRTNERIAQELVIAKSTVDTHLRRIYAKCGVHSRQELLDLAERKR